MHRTALSILAATALAACGSPAGRPGPDAAIPDGPPVDAASPDAPAPDAPLPDAALPDAPPVVVHVVDLDPQMGPAGGGDRITFDDDGFVDGATAAQLGTAPLGGLSVVSSTQLTGTAPSGAGFADATVTIGATTATLPRAYHHGAWAPTGPSGGPIRDLATAGAADVFAATAAGVYRSTDRGASWAAASAGLGGLDVRGLAVDPGQPARVFAATAAGVYVTTTAGASWALAGNSPPSATRIAIAPGNPDLLLALEPPRLHRSTDGGVTWTQVLAGVGGGEAIAFAPADPSLVLLAINNGRGPGILKSTDGGSTWGPAAAGIGNTFVTSVAFDPDSPAIVYAVAMSKVYKSRNGAVTWSQLTGYNLPFVPPARIVIDPAGVLYAGSSDAKVAKSSDGGTTWTDISNGIAADITSDINCLAVRASAPAELHISVGTEGIFRSLDAGASWARSDTGVTTTGFSHVAASPAAAGRALAIGGATVWRTLDRGATWLRSSSGLPELAPARALGFHPSQADVALVGTNGAGVYRTTDGGATWTASNQGLTGVQVNALLFDPDAPSRVYAAAEQGVYRSLDDGLTWTRVFAGDTTSIATAVVKRGAAVLVANRRLSRSLDDGATWAPFGTGLPTTGLTELHEDPADPAVAYAIADERVYRSADGGATWTAITPQGTRIAALAIDPTRSATIYLVAADGPAVLRSLTGLATLRRFDAGLSPGSVTAIAVDRSGGVVYLGTAAAGLRRAGG